MPAEPMKVQLSAEATAEGINVSVASLTDMPEDMQESYSSEFPELNIQVDNSDEEEAAMGDMPLEEAHETAGVQPDAGLAYPQVEYGQGSPQPAFQPILVKDGPAKPDQQGSAALTDVLDHLQGQADALKPVLRMLGRFIAGCPADASREAAL